MREKLREFFRDKKVLILGFGREGKSSYRVIRELWPELKITIADQREDFDKDVPELATDINAEIVSGERYLEGLEKYDIIMKTPGISFAKLDVEKMREKIYSQLELLLEMFDGITIGVTATKGKSTTSTLTYKVLQDQQVPSLLMGNIGVPVFDDLDLIHDDTILVLEMSSHQLEFMRRSPKIAIILNIYEEHLDHYRSFGDYALAKCNIFKYQNETDRLFYGADNQTLSGLVAEVGTKAEKYSVGTEDRDRIILKDGEIWFGDEKIFAADTPRNLRGEYNLLNIAFVLSVAKVLGLDLGIARRTVSEFKTLPHRLEFVAEVNGVNFYDNSIGTVPAATIAVIEALGDVDTLIIGGMDRGLDYSEFVDYLNRSEIQNVICMPKTGHDVFGKLRAGKKVETLEEAVALAKKVTAKGKSCLLSPAAASYGFFKNFEEKGNLYQQFVKEG